MSVGGGEFIVQDKLLPGSYVNFISKAKAMGTVGERGTVALMLNLNGGVTEEIYTVTNEDFKDKCLEYFGCDYSHKDVIEIREALIGAKKAVIYVLKGKGKQATGSKGALKVTAVFEGGCANDSKIVITEDVDSGFFTIKTYYGSMGILVDQQEIEETSELVDNKFVTFTIDKGSSLTAGTIILSGGSRESAVAETCLMGLGKLEKHDFDVLGFPNGTAPVNKVLAANIRRMREEEGKKIQLVVSAYGGVYNDEGVIALTTNRLLPWYAGHLASALPHESLTNKIYDGEQDVPYNNSCYMHQYYVTSGLVGCYSDGKHIRVSKEINTLTEFSSSKNSDFANNQVLRVLDYIAADISRIFNTCYVGKTQNNTIGREVFKAELVNYHNNLLALGAIDNFSSDDIKVTKGAEKGAVVVETYIEPIAAMDKLYMTCVIV